MPKKETHGGHTTYGPGSHKRKIELGPTTNQPFKGIDLSKCYMYNLKFCYSTKCITQCWKVINLFVVLNFSFFLVSPFKMKNKE